MWILVASLKPQSWEAVPSRHLAPSSEELELRLLPLLASLRFPFISVGAVDRDALRCGLSWLSLAFWPLFPKLFVLLPVCFGRPGSLHAGCSAVPGVLVPCSRSLLETVRLLSPSASARPAAVGCPVL